MNRVLDFSPLFQTEIGVYRLADVMGGLSHVNVTAYPPYNIKKIKEDEFQLSIAVAGFKAQNIKLAYQNNTLTISGQLTDEKEEQQGEYLHLGITQHAFERKFVLANHIQVEKADLNDGLLQISLKVVLPENLKLHQIPINGGLPQQSSKILDNTLDVTSKKLEEKDQTV